MDCIVRSKQFQSQIIHIVDATQMKVGLAQYETVMRTLKRMNLSVTLQQSTLTLVNKCDTLDEQGIERIRFGHYAVVNINNPTEKRSKSATRPFVHRS